jgi:hypothetical protein
MTGEDDIATCRIGMPVDFMHRPANRPIAAVTESALRSSRSQPIEAAVAVQRRLKWRVFQSGAPDLDPRVPPMRRRLPGASSLQVGADKTDRVRCLKGSGEEKVK